MKSSSPCWSEILSGFRLLSLFSAILFLASNAFAGSGQITPNPSAVNFGSIAVGASQMQTVTLTNSGGTRLTITQASLSGTGFTFSGLIYPVTLAGGQSVTAKVKFAPQSSGADIGMVSISFTTLTRRGRGITNTATLPLSGTGMTSGQLTAVPSSLAFGNVQVGSSQTMTETLTNPGGASVTISGDSATGSGFTASGLTLPITVSAGQSVSFSVTFTPTSGSAASGNLAIASNASNTSLSVPLAGTGVTPGQLAASPASLSFGSVTAGSSSSLVRETDEHGRIVSHNFSDHSPAAPASALSGITLPRDTCRSSERNLHRIIRTANGRQRKRKSRHQLHRIESQFLCFAIGNGRQRRPACGQSGKPRLWKRDDRQHCFSFRETDEHRGIVAHNFPDHSQRHRVQFERNYSARHVGRGSERDLQRDIRATNRRQRERKSRHQLQRIESYVFRCGDWNRRSARPTRGLSFYHQFRQRYCRNTPKSGGHAHRDELVRNRLLVRSERIAIFRQRPHFAGDDPGRK